VAINLYQFLAIMGFSDGGAHLCNTAFHNFGLRCSNWRRGIYGIRE